MILLSIIIASTPGMVSYWRKPGSHSSERGRGVWGQRGGEAGAGGWRPEGGKVCGERGRGGPCTYPARASLLSLLTRSRNWLQGSWKGEKESKQSQRKAWSLKCWDCLAWLSHPRAAPGGSAGRLRHPPAHACVNAYTRAHACTDTDTRLRTGMQTHAY